MVGIIDRAADLLEDQLGFQVVFRLMEGRTEGTMIRRVPATTVGRYMDRKRAVAFLFQVVVKREREDIAIRDIDAIVRVLDGCYLGLIEAEFVSCEVYTEAAEIDWDDSGFHAYGARFRALINV